MDEEASDIEVREAGLPVPLTKFEFEEGEHRTRRMREWARQWIGLVIVSSLAAIVLLSFALVWTAPGKGEKPFTMDDYVKLVQALIGPVAGIVGAVTGFYFGSSERDRERDQAERSET